MIDDSELFHGTYDPVKARAYYLRTRKLKGRKPGKGKQPSSGRRSAARPTAGGVKRQGKANRANTKSRRAELKAQKEALEKRLDRLREHLAKLVEEAKGRSGVKKPKKQEGKKAAASAAGTSKSGGSSGSKKNKPLTQTQKREKAKKAKEAYEKENPTSLSKDIDILQEQIHDVRDKIEKAIKDAQQRKNKAGKAKSSKVRSNANSNSGPKGR